MYSQGLLNKAQSGDVSSMKQLGKDLYYGNGTKKNYAEALSWMEKAVWSGDARNGSELSWMIMNNPSNNKNYYDAFYYAYHAALAGDGIGSMLVGAFFDGNGGGNVVPVNYYTANYWYKKAVDLNCTQACIHLAENYLNGRGDLTSPEKAIEVLKKGAELNDAECMSWLGNIYEGAWGDLSKNENLAGYWYNEASKRGHNFAKERIQHFRYSSLTKRWKKI